MFDDASFSTGAFSTSSWKFPTDIVVPSGGGGGVRRSGGSGEQDSIRHYNEIAIATVLSMLENGVIEWEV